jgi:hypothetical protein
MNGNVRFLTANIKGLNCRVPELFSGAHKGVQFPVQFGKSDITETESRAERHLLA